MLKVAEELVVEVVAVGQNDQRRVFHLRVLDDLTGVERHQQALAGALRVPDDAHLAVALRPRRRQRAFHGMAHGMELVVAGENFGESLPGVAEDDEIFTRSRKRGCSKTPLMSISSSGVPFGAGHRRSLCARA